MQKWNTAHLSIAVHAPIHCGIDWRILLAKYSSEGHGSSGDSEIMLWLADSPFMSLLICYETADGFSVLSAASCSPLAANSSSDQLI